ncbi:hypothetical protein BJY04DRAFT_199636 [Aspergillus karnatakaensis]|uniref:uncharacterized protein n=1 Tax=Aspergillus karnatakaensis TaxID=1810916 RepID=UPI003CCD0518
MPLTGFKVAYITKAIPKRLFDTCVVEKRRNVNYSFHRQNNRRRMSCASVVVSRCHGYYHTLLAGFSRGIILGSLLRSQVFYLCSNSEPSLRDPLICIKISAEWLFSAYSDWHVILEDLRAAGPVKQLIWHSKRNGYSSMVSRRFSVGLGLNCHCHIYTQTIYKAITFTALSTAVNQQSKHHQNPYRPA